MRLELAAGTGDGRRARDRAGLRRRLGAAPGLNLSITGHGRYRERFYAFFVALRALQINGSRLLLRRGAGKLRTRNA